MEFNQMDSMAAQSDSGLFKDDNMLTFIHLQLVELTRDCGNTIQNGQASLEYYQHLQDKLEKILHETHVACSPPVRRPVMSDFETVRTVNLVHHKETNQNLAMKMIRWDKVTKSTKAMVCLERDILTFGNNPFVISMFCTMEAEEHLCMVMEHAGGGDCEGLLDRYECPPLDLSRLYVAETVSALEYLHSYSILHGDIKPANLLISSTGHIKLADFGLSKIGLANMTVDPKDLRRMAKEFSGSDMFGTPPYVSPEMIQGKGYGKTVDWWALGIILHQFLLGKVPFDGDSFKGIFNEVVSTQSDSPDMVAPQNRTLLAIARLFGVARQRRTPLVKRIPDLVAPQNKTPSAITRLFGKARRTRTRTFFSVTMAAMVRTSLAITPSIVVAPDHDLPWFHHSLSKWRRTRVKSDKDLDQEEMDEVYEEEDIYSLPSL